MPLAPRLPKKRSGLSALPENASRSRISQRVAAEQPMAGRQALEQRRNQRAFEVLARTTSNVAACHGLGLRFGLRKRIARQCAGARFPGRPPAAPADLQPDRPESACWRRAADPASGCPR
jgi:hypothetical protein